MINKLSDLEEKKTELRGNANAAQEASNAAPPSAEEIAISIKPNIENKNCEMHIRLEKPGWIIRSVILFSDTLFAGGSFVVHPSESTN